MFTTTQYNINSCECGVPLSFGLIRPNKEKLAEITTLQVSNRVVTLTTRGNHNIKVNDLVEIIAGTNFSSIFTGKRNIIAVTANSISFTLNTLDRVATTVNAYIYSVPNIDSRDQYIIKYSKELSVPDTAELTITPSTYTMEKSNSFIPETVVKIVSKFTTSSKTIIKLSITDIYNQILYTEYKQIICSQQADKPCEIIAKKPVVPTSISLNRKNNWIYKHNGYTIAQFIPNKDIAYESISISLDKQSDAILPIATDFDRLVIKIDPLLMQNKSVTKDQLRSIIVNNPISTSLQKNVILEDTYNTWVVQGSGLTVDQLKGLVIYSSSNGTVVVSVSAIGEVIRYVPKPQPIPSIVFLKWFDHSSNKEYFFGQMLYYTSIYENKDIVLVFNGNNITFRLNNFATPNYGSLE